MVETQLTDSLIDEGKRLIESLDARGASPHAAFWIFLPDIAGWKLVLSELESQAKGPRETYALIQSALKHLKPAPSQLSLEDVAAAAPESPLVRLLRSALGTGFPLTGIRFTNNVVNGTLIPDAYVYRLAKAQSREKAKK